MYRKLIVLAAFAASSLSCANWMPSTQGDPQIRVPVANQPVADLESSQAAPMSPETLALVTASTAASEIPPTEKITVVEPSRRPSSLPALQTVVGDLYQPEVRPELNLTCAELMDLIKAQPSTVEELLNGIQKLRPKFLTRTVYAYQTTMPFDDATLAFPRAVVYGGDAKVVLNFGGRHRQRSFERMEAMCFDDAQAKFDFYDIVFPKEAPSKEAIADLTEPERAMKSVVIAGGRGQRECKNCHQDNPRPNWDTYSLWPGFYGATDDVLKDRDRPDFRPTYATFEYNHWQQFQSVPAKRARYTYTSQELDRANSDFTLRLSYLNGRRIVGDLKRMGKDFEPHKYEFARALFCTPKAPRQFFRQITGDSSSLGGNFAVLPDSTDAETKDIFLSAYYDEMQKEKRLGEILATVGIPSPLPKEHFELLRAYYRSLFQDKELNLDLRLSTVDVDEVLLVRALMRVTDKLGIDFENWSMVRDGGYVHENGLGGEGKPALRLILERPFVNEFLKDDADIASAISAREAAENAYSAPGSVGKTPDAEKAIEAADSKICGLLSKR